MATSFIEFENLSISSPPEEREQRMSDHRIKNLNWSQVQNIMVQEYHFNASTLSRIFAKFSLISPYEFVYFTEDEIHAKLQSLYLNDAEKRFVLDVLGWIEVVLLMKYYKTQNPFELIRRIAMVNMMSSVSKRERVV